MKIFYFYIIYIHTHSISMMIQPDLRGTKHQIRQDLLAKVVKAVGPWVEFLRCGTGDNQSADLP